RAGEQLRVMGLDWDPPARASRSDDNGGPASVEVYLGEWPQPERESLILAICPFDAGAFYRRGVAYARLDRSREALADFCHALAPKPNDAEAHYWRGLGLSRQGKDAGARADLSRTSLCHACHAKPHEHGR